MGMEGISKSQVSRLCGEIDERVNTFLRRPIEGEWPYLWLDADPRESPARPPHRLGRGDYRCRRQHRWPARSTA